MIHSLSFAEPDLDSRVRELRWLPKSAVEVPQACALTSGLAARLAAALGMPVDVSLHEPVAPSRAVAAALLAGTLLYAVDAAQGRAWIFLEEAAGKTLVAAAFGETRHESLAPLSLLERGTLERMLRDVAEAFSPWYGAVTGLRPSGDYAEAGKMSTLLALRLGDPFNLEIDLALAADPVTAPPVTLSLSALNEVPVRVRVTAGSIKITCSKLSTLKIGEVLPMSREGRTQLLIDQSPIANGTCGIIGRQLAFRIDNSLESQGA